MLHGAVKKESPSFFKQIAGYLLLAAMLAASVWLWRFLDNVEKTESQARFAAYCEKIRASITHRLRDYEMILKGGAGFFYAFKDVSQAQWRAYVEYRQVKTFYPGIQGIGFAEVVPAAELQRHVEMVRAEAFPEYTVRPEGERAIYVPVVFLEPLDPRNRLALGYDMFSEPLRRAAMERARDTGMPALSGRVKLVQETSEDVQPGFLLYVPVYARDMAQGSVEERRATLRGYVYAAFRVKDLMLAIFGRAPREVAFDLYDGPTASPEALVFDSRELEAGFGQGRRSRFSAQYSLEFYGHTWTLAFHSTPEFEAKEAAQLPWIILVAGFVVTTLVFLVIRAQEDIATKARAVALAERRRAESDRIARQAAEEASRAKSAFLSNMSHEIRTPLNAMLGFAQILERDGSLTPRQKEMIHTINRSGQHLLNLINDILDMSKIEAGRLELNPVDFCLHDLLEDLEMMFRSRAEAKGLQLLMERADDLPRYVHADEAKLRQVFINLVGNAVKFTKTGGVAVRVRAETLERNSTQDTHLLRLVVEIEDSGPGIAADELELIFEPFRQSAAGRDAGGTGLGLAVSRRLVELMGGSIGVRSELGKGSCFFFQVPVKLAAGAAQEVLASMRQVVGLEPGTGPFRILVADDRKDNRDLLRALLEPLGVEVKEAANGQEALDLFEGWSPHAVLMDMRMPVMDGYEATRRIKATEKGRITPVIAVTATAFEGAKREVMATGVDGYVRKPFRAEEIFAVLGKCLGLRYVYAEDTGQAAKDTNVGPLTSEDLAGLPEALRRDMLKAVEDGDMAELRALIAQIRETDAGMASKLKNLADQYDYEGLSRVLGGENAGLDE